MSAVKIEVYRSEFKQIIDEWWIARNLAPPVDALLPKLGAVVFVDGAPVIAGWLTMSNSHGVCELSYLVANPNRLAHYIRAASALINYLQAQAKQLDYGVMTAHISNPKLAAIAEIFGFEHPVQTTTLTKIL